MKKLFSKKGFTLIELLIVIAIIGILAVAFLPSILGAPAKGRDTARIADVQKLANVLVAKSLETPPVNPPAHATAGTAKSFVVNDANFGTNYKGDLGGKIPTDPGGTTTLAKYPTIAAIGAGGAAANGYYFYVSAPGGVYNLASSFVIMTPVENTANANADCTDAAIGTLTAPATAGDYCYAVFVK